MRAVLNTVSVLLLTFLLVRLDDWRDTFASAVNAFSQTAPWISFRSTLNVCGPESEQDLMIASITVAAFVTSILVVWAVNRVTRGSTAFRRSETIHVTNLGK